VTDAGYTVVGCSYCAALWIVRAGRRRTRECPQGGQRYRPESRSRRRRSTNDTQRGARLARSIRLADRYAASEVGIDGDPHRQRPARTDPFPGWLRDQWTDCYADAFADAVDAHPL
jgi:hypothetical protein